MNDQIRLTAPPILVHLTSGLDTLSGILSMGVVSAKNPIGAVHNHSELRESQKAVSLSEIDLADLHRLAARHGDFGIGLHRRRVQQGGAAPVWYLPRESPLQAKLFQIIKQLAYRGDPELGHFLWELTPFIDYPRDSDWPGTPYDWRWEREWRVQGDLHFLAGDIAALFGPEAEHDAVRALWLSLETFGATVIPPILDPAWPVERQIAELLEVSSNRPSTSPSTSTADSSRWWLVEPPDDPAFEEFPEPHVGEAPFEIDYEAELDPEQRLMAILAKDGFDFNFVWWVDLDGDEALGGEPLGVQHERATDDHEGGDVPMSYDIDYDPEPYDPEPEGEEEQRREWASWLELAERDDA